MKTFLKTFGICCTLIVLIGCQTTKPPQENLHLPPPERPQDIKWCGMPPTITKENNFVKMDERSFQTLRCLLEEFLRWKMEAELLLQFYEDNSNEPTI